MFGNAPRMTSMAGGRTVRRALPVRGTPRAAQCGGINRSRSAFEGIGVGKSAARCGDSGNAHAPARADGGDDGSIEAFVGGPSIRALL